MVGMELRSKVSEYVKERIGGCNVQRVRVRSCCTWQF